MATLYIVPTPVGNMEDITARALRVLREASLILAEDTRTTGNLLRHFGIRNALASHHKFNERQTVRSIVSRLEAGGDIALVSDAGTPGISDPGFLLARSASEAGHDVVALPGATAFVPALVCSGLPCDRFCFEGFLPTRKGRKARLERLSREERTMALYESPRRVVRTLQDLALFLGEDRQASVSREISKLHEETVRGTLAQLLARFQSEEPRGEFVIVVAGQGESRQEPSGSAEAEDGEDAEKGRPLSKYRLKQMKLTTI